MSEEEFVDPEYLALKAQLQAESERMARNVETLSGALRQDLRYAPYVFEMEGYRTFSLSNGMWAETMPGIRMMLIDDVYECGGCSMSCGDHCGCSRVMMEVTGGMRRIPRHKHAFDEKVTVIKGKALSVQDDGSVLSASPGESLVHERQVWHEVELEGIFLVCWHPPLTRHQDPMDVAFAQLPLG